MSQSRLFVNLDSAPRLTAEEVAALRRGDLELECPVITLTGKARTLRGGGWIRQGENRFAFAIYSQEPIELAQFPPRLNLPPGEFIPGEHYFDLHAIDTSGREWRATMLPGRL